MQVSEANTSKASVPRPEEVLCGICLNRVSIQGALNQCQHIFCYQCIMQWSKKETSCPNCRRFYSFVTRIFWFQGKPMYKDYPLYVPYICQQAQVIRLSARALQQCGLPPENYRMATTNPNFHQVMAQWGYPALQIIEDDEDDDDSRESTATISDFSEYSSEESS